MALLPGEIIEGKYRIVRLVGEGGMGSVYEGENLRIHRKVAIKVLHASVAAKGDVVQRFEREAQAAGRIGSEHIVEVLDLGSLPGGERYMVMEFLEGESLGDRIKKRRRLSPHETAPIIYQLLEGLSAAHQAGIIHRDLKPDNVFVVGQRGPQRDFVKVLDFGVSKFSALDNSDMSMTKTGAVMGTPFYMSPEQARGAKIDTRSDLYSVGVVMYQSVTGRVPFSAETFNELVFKIALESPEPAESVTPGLERGFAQIIARAMVRDANGRFQTAREFQQALAQWIQNTPSSGVDFTPPAFQTGSGSHPRITPYGHDATAFQNTFPGSADARVLTPDPRSLTPNGQAMSQHAPGGVLATGPHQPITGGMPAHLTASEGGLAVSAPKDRGSGLVIAIAAMSMLVLAGGGFAVFKALGHGSAIAPPVPPPAAVPAPIEPATSPPAATDAPAATTTPVEPAATQAPVATAAPSVKATAKPSSTTRSTPTSKPTATAAPATTPTPKPTSTGRTVPGDL